MVYKIMYEAENKQRELFLPLTKYYNSEPPNEVGWAIDSGWTNGSTSLQEINLQNSLPADVMMDTSTEGFKRGLDKYMEARSINGY